MKVVFTGPAADAAGNPILRADLKAAAQKAGHIVLDNFAVDAELLVASRVDTVKARKAAQMGIEVVDYPTFLQGLEKPPTAAKSRNKPDPWVDHPILPKTPASAGLVGNEL